MSGPGGVTRRSPKRPAAIPTSSALCEGRPPGHPFEPERNGHRQARPYAALAARKVGCPATQAATHAQVPPLCPKTKRPEAIPEQTLEGR